MILHTSEQSRVVKHVDVDCLKLGTLPTWSFHQIHFPAQCAFPQTTDVLKLLHFFFSIRPKILAFIATNTAGNCPEISLKNIQWCHAYKC